MSAAAVKEWPDARSAADAAEGRPAAPAVSLFRYSPGLILLTVAITDGLRIADNDLWGHVRFGQAMLALHHALGRDPYSYSVPGVIWNDHEWLSQVLLAAVYNWAGVSGLILLKLVCAAATIGFLAAALAETGAPAVVQFCVLILSAAVMRPQFQFRPQLFTMVLLAALLWLLTRNAYRRTGRLWLAVPMLAVWANLHGGFVMGLAALGIDTAVSGLQDIFARRGYRRAHKLSAITIAAALVTAATPYGLGTWRAVLHSLGDRYTGAAVQDWLPLVSTMTARWRVSVWPSNWEMGLALMAATGLSWVVSIEAADLPLVAIAAVTAASAFISARNLPLAAIACAAPLARHLPRALGRIRPRFAEMENSVRNLPWRIDLLFAVLSLLVLVESGLFLTRLPTDTPFPAGASAFMNQHSLEGNILNEFDWGEYLIWHLAPQSKVFIDGRCETVYPDAVFRNYLAFRFGQPGGAQLLDHYSHDFVLIRSESEPRKLMDSRRDWTLIYEDDVATLYARSGSAAARLPGIPIRGASLSASFP